ncbi:MAG TPA: aminotransferase class V-fold PLP-dependent enzyme [Steroidobacteraceae bacterium]|jgi:alanine-glyoxylate transaminase/serine-glyoxylate transaminase/serine-pyruvate transaminase|nr:aminotransferase class V-fold PLP-dependent enzyme [Steroidobacteraceae bacterium]
MLTLDFHAVGRHFLQVPGPSPVPERILRAMSLPTIDHRGPEFGALGLRVLSELRGVFKTRQPVVLYPASGTGAWEAALSNTLSPGDHVLMYETGQFALLWVRMAQRLGLEPEVLEWRGADPVMPAAPGWRHGVSAALIEERLAADKQHRIKAVCVVHNETSTGVTSDMAAVRRAIDAAKHPALLMVDTVSGLASADYRHDEWGVDVSISGSQKGLMMPPGMSFNAISARALEASKTAKLPRSYWAWDEMLEANQTGYFPYTPNTNLLYGLAEALEMLRDEGLDTVFARHRRWGEAVRGAINAWGLPIQCADPKLYSPVSTAVILPAGVNADAVRADILKRFDLSLGMGLGKIKGRVFRIGHLGNSNDLTVLAGLVGCEMGLKLAGVDMHGSGVAFAMEYFASRPAPQATKANTAEVRVA